MQPNFAAIVRTTGSRPRQLLDALQSLSLQKVPCLPVVVVHGDHAAIERVRRTCEGPVILHAPDTGRRRGHPINVGLDYCLGQPGVEFLFPLDDDDVVYPYFTSMIAGAFRLSNSDLVYSASNRREPGKVPSPGHAAKPFTDLFRENFIATGSYAIRAEALRGSGVRVDETLEYMEDWHFLLRMLEAGLRFHPIPATLSEFRIVSDSDLVLRRDLDLWKKNATTVRGYINTTSFAVPGTELARISLSGTAARGAPGSRPADQVTIASLRKRVAELEGSLSWKWTGPLRSLLGMLLALRGRRRARA